MESIGKVSIFSPRATAACLIKVGFYRPLAREEAPWIGFAGTGYILALFAHIDEELDGES